MTIRIEIKSTEVSVRSGIGKSGRPYEIVEQIGFIELNDERRKLRINVDKGAQPYAPGEYTLDESSFSVDQYGGLAVRVRLKALAKSAARAA